VARTTHWRLTDETNGLTPLRIRLPRISAADANKMVLETPEDSG